MNNTEELDSMTHSLPEEIEQKFAEIAKAGSKRNKDQYLWKCKGLTKFKRKLLGFCGNHATKSVGDITKVLMDMGIVNSEKESEQLVRKLEDTNCDYGWGKLFILKDENRGGFYSISKQNYEDYDYHLANIC